MKLIAGTGCPSTKETLQLTELAAEYGYNAAMVVTPFYYTSRVNDQMLLHHYTAIADSSPIPIILYKLLISSSLYQKF